MSEQELQRRAATTEGSEAPVQAIAEGGDNTRFSSAGAIPPVGAAGVAQQSASERGYGADEQTHAIADKAVAGGGSTLPFANEIAKSFGPQHAGAVQNIKAHTGQNAKQGADALGAKAFAYGNDVVLNDKTTLHDVAHEAAHVVQQNAGVATKMKVGQPNDPHEQEADQIADRVVAGQSAADLLEPHAEKEGGGAGKAVQSKAVQFLGHELGTKLPEGTATPKYGEDTDQRRYSREQYETMWEEEQKRKLKPGEKSTIERGCIGITANNIAGGGNPLDYSEANFSDFDVAHKYMQGKNIELKGMRAKPETAGMVPADGEYILFAKLFWSNQQAGDNSKPDENAFKEDPKTKRMDMSGYKYKGQPGYVNFDYGYWDDSTQAFWHANHMEHKDPEKQKTDPMKVYQSTKDRFIAGYIDFDRIVFGVAFAKNYDPGKSAMNSAGR